MSNRMIRVRELMKRELGTILSRDFEIAKGSLITVTGVDVTPDLRNSFVYISVVGSADPEKVIEALEERRPQIQKTLYSRIVLKYSPSLSFRIDDSIERGNKVIDLISEVDELPTAEDIEAFNQEAEGE